MGAASATSYPTSSISTSASNVQKYVDTYHRLPSTVSVNGTTVSSAQFLYLETKDVQYVYRKINTPVTLKNVQTASSPKESLTSNTLTQSQYIIAAYRITNYIETYNKAPNYAATSAGNIRYENLVYTYSKILSFYKTYNRLPNSVAVTSWSSILSKSTSSSSGITSGGTVQFTDTSKGQITKTLIGSNSYGTVYKIGPFGNKYSKNKMAIIIGVHPQESAAHLAMLNALKTLSSKLTNVQIWLFQVVVNPKYGADYTLSRTYGQNLAYKYIVPQINTSYKLALDTHGNRGLYATNDFVFAPSKGSISVSYASKIIKTTNYLKYYSVADGTSPKYVTLPIANKGIPAVIFELYLNVDKYNIVLYNKCLQVVKGLNTIFA